MFNNDKVIMWGGEVKTLTVKKKKYVVIEKNIYMVTGKF